MIVVDNTTLQAERKRTIIVSIFVYGKRSDIVVQDIFYVPDFSINLLPVRKITEKGYK